MQTLRSIILFSSIVLTMSCQKDDLVEITMPVNSIDYINDRLVFSNQDCYEELVNNLIYAPSEVFSLLREKNKRTLKSTNLLNDSLYDDFLQSILSQEKIVQIGEWIIKVDLENNCISALDEKKIQYIDDLKSNNVNENILYFTPEQEVLILLDSIKSEQNGLKSTEGIFCNDRWAAAKKDDGFEEYGDGYRLDCKVVYQKAGIYFSLQAKVKNQVKVLGIWYARNDALWMWYNASWSKRCGNSGTANQAYCSSCYSYDNVLDARVYSSTRALEHYSYSVVFSNQFAGFWTRSYSISD